MGNKRSDPTTFTALYTAKTRIKRQLLVTPKDRELKKFLKLIEQRLVVLRAEREKVKPTPADILRKKIKILDNKIKVREEMLYGKS